MDLLGRVIESTESKSDDYSKSIVTRSLSLMEYPEDIVRMVFREAMCKPALHFAEFRLGFPRHETGKGCDMLLERWSRGNMKSGYVTGEILQETCSLARNVALYTTVKPSTIRYSDGWQTVDASTDVLCLVHPERCCTSVVLPFQGGESPTWWPMLDHPQVAATLGSIRRAGVRVSNQLLHELFETWFCLGEDEFTYKEWYGELHRTHLAVLMTCFRDLEAFYLILTDIKEEDWDTYYVDFPTVFHEHTGSYVEVDEQPTNDSVLRQLWGYAPSNAEYPYPEGSDFKGSSNNGGLVDRLIQPQQRVSLLLGLLHAAKSEARYKKDLEGLKLRVLARKPTGVKPELRTSVKKTYKPLVPRDEYFVGVDLQPCDSDAKWVKQALGRIQRESDEMDEKEAVSDDEEE
ncbi:hypothetical protein CONLIGDRAFT_648665 [Coniochaeta ligniaria NRRL 30616]|uniref:Uncharacterized protein n=1 Tax=Coniochaeta ligniaria NRRL 30616 TaxID=1408157 RepID=A0A1J7IB33_9PEZI|nr:hypothetical protein CONLIGDRAFT_648665 [Coniochaeta ligniaria NRRL 30616]